MKCNVAFFLVATHGPHGRYHCAVTQQYTMCLRKMLTFLPSFYCSHCWQLPSASKLPLRSCMDPAARQPGLQEFGGKHQAMKPEWDEDNNVTSLLLSTYLLLCKDFNTLYHIYSP